MTTILFLANTDWYLYNFRLALAEGVRDWGGEVCFVSPPGEYVSKLKNRGFRWLELPLERTGTDPFRDLASLRRIAAIYRRIAPDLVHHFTIKPVLYGSIAAWLSGVPAVVNAVTGLGYVFVRGGWQGWLLRAMVKPVYRFALTRSNSRAIFQNSVDLEKLEERGLVRRGDAVIIRGSGVDVARYAPTPEAKGIPKVVLASRMLWEKGVGDLVEASKILREQGVKARVVLAGALDPEYRSSIPEVQLLEWVDQGLAEWVGHQEDMPSVYRDSHVVALPTFYGEGVPRSLVEAAAAGRPIVASDIPGCREIVQHGVNGLLVPPQDPAALAEALRTLLLDPDLRMRMGRAGRDLAVVEFSNEKVTAETLAVYENLIEPPLPRQ